MKLLIVLTLLIFLGSCSTQPIKESVSTQIEHKKEVSPAVKANAYEIAMFSEYLSNGTCNVNVDKSVELAQAYVNLGYFIEAHSSYHYMMGVYVYMANEGKISKQDAHDFIIKDLKTSNRVIEERKGQILMEEKHHCVNNHVLEYFMDLGISYSSAFGNSELSKKGYVSTCIDDAKYLESQCNKMFSSEPDKTEQEYLQFDEYKRILTKNLLNILQ